MKEVPFELDKTTKERFLSKVEVNKITGCWEWEATTLRNGYGQIWVKDKMVLAHRVAYILYVGALLPGKQIDHICHNRKCVNPKHLELVTPKENINRGVGNVHKGKTHCIRGHEFTKENTYDRGRGDRECRICIKIRTKNNAKSSKT